MTEPGDGTLPRLRVRTRPLDDDRPLLDLLPVGASGGDATIFIHDDGGEAGLVGWGEATRLTPGPGTDRMRRLDDTVAELAGRAGTDDPLGVPGSGLVSFVSVTFDARAGGTTGIVPRRVVGRDHDRTWLTEIDPIDPGGAPADGGEPPPGPATGPHPDPVADRVRYAGSSMPDLHWLEAVADATKRIEDGAVDKIVLARDHAVWSRHPFDPRVLARRLHARFPACFTFLVDGLLGASPELLVRRTGDEVTSVTLAGTAPRGDTPGEDRRLGARLRDSDKDRREHAFAADDVRATLTDHCRRLEGDDEPVLLRLDNLQHLASRFSGELAEPASALRVADWLHPTPAVGGTPTDTAVEMIRELEGMDRARYAGPVGWVDGRGDGELAIALRCGELTGARARLFAGAGIVAGSLPEDELEETRVKLRAMQSAFSPDSTPR